MSEIKVLGICGSLRKGSYNHALLKVAEEEMPEGMSLTVADIGSFPAYDNDHEHEPTEAVKKFKEQIRHADAILFVSPEYNYSIPGFLKNAIDWASRPPAENPFRDKPAAIMGASIGNIATARMQYHLRQVAVFLDMHVMNKPEVMVGTAQNKFDADGKLTDAATREIVHKAMVALGEWTKRLKKA